MTPAQRRTYSLLTEKISKAEARFKKASAAFSEVYEEIRPIALRLHEARKRLELINSEIEMLQQNKLTLEREE